MEKIVFNHCVPFNGQVKMNYKFEIRAEDKERNKQDVGRDLMAMWVEERIAPDSLPEGYVAFYLRYNGESLYTYLVYPMPKACDFAATLIVEKDSPANKALDGAYVIDERYYH